MQEDVDGTTKLAQRIGVRLDPIEFIDEVKYLDFKNPEDIQALRDLGKTDKEIENAKNNGEKWRIRGTYVRRIGEGGQRWAAIRNYKGSNTETLAHEFVHAIDDQGGLPGWSGTPEQQVYYLQEIIAEAKEDSIHDARNATVNVDRTHRQDAVLQ